MTAVPNYGERLKIGMILASKNTVAEADAVAMLPAGVSLHTTRLRLVDTDPVALRKMTDDAEAAAGLVASAGPGIIVFHCTAASTIDPDMGSKVAERIQRATGIRATATSEALVASLRALKAKKIILLSPYPQHVNEAEVAFFRHHGIETLKEAGYLPPKGESSPYASPEEWRQRTLSLGMPEADAYFLSCTNIRCISVIGALEEELQKPVISSNQAMIWHVLRMAGIPDAIPGYGRLLNA